MSEPTNSRSRQPSSSGSAEKPGTTAVHATRNQSRLAQRENVFSTPTTIPSPGPVNSLTPIVSTSLKKSPVDETPASRRSGRAIKRKKFDDEMILTSAIPSITSSAIPYGLSQSPLLSPAQGSLSAQGSPAPVSQPPFLGTASPTSPNASTPPTLGSSGLLPPNSHSSFPKPQKCGSGKGKKNCKKGIRTFNSRPPVKKSKIHKKKKPRKDEAWKDLGRWKPTDDLALITAVLQTNDLEAVHRGVKFSCHFTFVEVELRWKALMFSPVLSKLALQAIRNLPPEIVLSIQRKTLLSQQEKDLLGTIKSSKNPYPPVQEFRELLSSNPGVFHSARSPESLLRHWLALKQSTLLPDQTIQPLPRNNQFLNFLDAEASVNDAELDEPRDEFVYREMAAADRKTKVVIRRLEAEIQKWQMVVDNVRGENPPDFDNQTLAVLRGRLVRYLMRSKEITIGRSTKYEAVDVDLKLEGPAWKISRKQGIISLKNSGEFFISNIGQRHIFIDGKAVRRGAHIRLYNNSVLEIGGLKFVFLINLDLIEAIRNEHTRTYIST